MFSPHLLVVPTGTSVTISERRPLLPHMSSRFSMEDVLTSVSTNPAPAASVRFDREGVSYIFCNIHPEMGGIILALSTPYYGISSENVAVSIHNVPPGSYQLNVWSENGQFANPDSPERIIQVSAAPVHLGDLALQTTADVLTNHKNKSARTISQLTALNTNSLNQRSHTYNTSI